MKSLDAYFSEAAKRNASDVHLVARQLPMIRVDGKLHLIDDAPLPADALLEAIFAMLTPQQRQRYTEDLELDISHSAGGARFRVNLHQQAGAIGLAARLIPKVIPSPEDLRLEPQVAGLTQLLDGLVLVVGPTGHGKSTTIASLIEEINKTRSTHIVTIEDPVEFVFEPKQSRPRPAAQSAGIGKLGMKVGRSAGRTARALLVAIVTAAIALSAAGASIATERYGSEDGLASDSVTALLADSRGFIWIGTNEGLSRFDGTSFTSFGTPDGLASAYVTALCEDTSGTVWIGTSRGLARVTRETLVAGGIEGFPSGAGVGALEALGDGNLLAIVDQTLWRITIAGGVARAARETWAAQVRDARVVAAGRGGEIWLGTVGTGLYRRTTDGRLEHFLVVPFEGSDGVSGLRMMDDGTLWIGTLAGFFLFRPDDGGADPRSLAERVGARVFRPGERWIGPAKAGEVTQLVREKAGRFDLLSLSPIVGPDGTIWAVTPEALLRSDRETWELIGAEAGLDVDTLTSATVDDAGNVWLGTLGSGALVVRQRGLVSYSRRDGLGTPRIQQIAETPAGELVVLAGWQLHRLERDRFRAIDLAPRGLQYQGWGWSQVLAFDGSGDAWVASGEGLYRYRGIRAFDDFASRRPRLYTKADGLGANDVFRVWADGGEVWAGTFGEAVIARYDAAHDRFVTWPPNGAVSSQAPTAFARDRAGGVWTGYYEGGVTRFDGTSFSRFGEAEGVPRGLVHALTVDGKGRLWIATARGGVCVVEHPTASPFRCRVLSIADGLSSATARALVEDESGAMWVGSTRGIDRVELETGAIRHVSRHDGLANNIVTAAYRDASGRLWFGTVGGLSCLTSQPVGALREAPTLITTVGVNGVTRLALPFGASSTPELSFGADTERIEIRFAAPRLSATGDVRYAWRVGGLDPEWKETASGSMTLERLPYRRFQFEVRALGADGTTAAVAHVPFRVLAPIWMRWWFVTAAAGLLVAIGYLWYRARVERLLAVERMRTQIATDLHDDLGSTLSRISILSEVAKLQTPEESPASRILGDIGESARNLVGALGDSIWSIDPRVDDLRSLVARARHHAVEMLEGAGVRSRFDVQEGLETVRLDPAQRRQIFLILKEALNNIARHSGARSVVVSIQLLAGGLLVEIVDDGRGFDPSSVSLREHGTGGRGVSSMRARAEALGGQLEIASRAGEGTTLVIRIPLGRRRV